MMRVALYYRVSTALQEKKFSLPAQKQELQTYAKQQGWHIVGEFKDVESGGQLKKDGLNALLDVVEEGGADVVLVVDQDRLSRLDTIAWEYLKSTLRDNSVKIAEPGSIVDLSNEDDEFISDIKNLIARREKKSIVRRMMRGKRQRLRDGKGWGQPNFEYRYNKETAKYEAIDEWRWVIPLIDDLYLNEQLGMKLISDRLNEVSLTPTGNKWNEHLVNTRLRSKAYHGVAEKDFNTGETISTDGIYEPLRTEETYNRIQEEMAKRTEQFSISGRKNSKNIHMLKRTYLTCGLCGRKLSIEMHGTKEKPRYYAKHGRKIRIKDGTRCGISINAIRFDQNILEALKSILTSEEMAKKYIDIDSDEEEVSDLKSKLKTSKKAIDKFKNSQDRLLDVYLSGDLSKNRYLEKDKEIESKVKIEEEAYEKMEMKLKAIDRNNFNYESLYQYMMIARDIEHKLEPLEKAQLIGTIFPRGMFYEDKLILTTEVMQGIPIDVTIPIDDDPFTWHSTKQARL